MDHYGCRYKGLMEQGSTCHLNSVLQVLFMTKEFREAVERNNSDDESLDFHLKNLFTDLKQQTGDTKHITEKLGITSERKQCDAAECLQNILRSLTDSVASQLFKGVIMRKNKCSKCTKETGTSEQFWSLPLELVDSFQDYSVADGIIKYFSESNVSGQDQLFCVDCNSKSDSTDKLEIQHHPEVLTLELKRYKFNYILKEDAKITCMVQIPMFLQIPSTGDQSQRYEVYACVELFGDRKRNGIYTVNIKSQDDDKWYHFNGISVRPSWPQPFQRSEEEKNKNACLLFYRKSFKYKGLLNQGSTCYLNSVLQVLFMTREFREAVERYNNEDDSPDFHLKSLFMDLKKNTGDTKHITKKLDITSGNKQSDAAECLEKILSSLTHSEASQLFTGVMMLKNKCSECRMETGTRKSFWSIPLELVDLYDDYSVVDGIIKYFSESGGSGQLFCKYCNNKTDSTNKLEMQHYPEVLSLALTRYKFDYTLKKDVKIECVVQIPRFLQIPTNEDQSQRYEVYACVEQLGDRKRYGTYTVKIKSQDDDKWYHFDDTRVSLSCPQPFQLSEERIFFACLLFYRKIPAPNIKEASTSGDVETEKTEKIEMDVETKEQSGSEAATQEPDEQDKTSLIPGFKYKGLLNQGSTCYLNSVLQVLFMTREFREAVERYNNEDDSPDFHLKSLFMDLKKNTGDTKHITKKLDITSGFEQPDAAECLQNILSNLTSSVASKLFKGVRILKNKCSQCKKETKTSEPFWRLPLLVDDDKDYNVEDGIIKYFSDLCFSGDRFCESCNTTYDSTDKLELRKHPEVLTLLLKRVQLDHLKKYAKISVTIPRFLHIPPSGDQSHIYELYAYVEHIGERNGEYTATIKSQDDDKWYNYDDTRVSQSCPQPFQVDNEEKNPYVYLLFYRKISATESVTEDINEASSSGSFEPETTEQSEVNVEAGEQGGGKERNKGREESEKETVKDAESKLDGRTDKHEGTKTLIPDQKSMSNEKKRHNQSDSSKVLQPHVDSVGEKQDGRSRVDNRKDEDKMMTPQSERGAIRAWVQKKMTEVYDSVSKRVCWTQSGMGPCSGYEYNGLMNQGSTCYLNSVLQVLFMTREFREAVERNTNDEESLDFHIKNLFMDLKEKTGDTKHITRKLGITSVYKQHDAAECLENILTSSKASQLFEGLLTIKNKCSKCEQESRTSDPFWSLPLELVHSNKDYSVADGIHRYFSESNLSGQDQLFCERCNTKSDSINKPEMERHPEVLTLLLKRFKFDYSLMNYVKIKRSVQIPKLLQIPISGDQSQKYELYAFVEHLGELRFGHYTVSIRSQDDGRWYDFDDTRVTLSPYQYFQLDNEEKNCSAYLLFYRKISAAETLTQDITKASTSGSFEPETTQQSVVNIKTKGQDGGDEAAGNERNMDREESDRETVKNASDKQEGRTDKHKEKNSLIDHNKTQNINDGERAPNSDIVDGVNTGESDRASVDKQEKNKKLMGPQNKTETQRLLTKLDLCKDFTKDRGVIEQSVDDVNEGGDGRTSVDDKTQSDNTTSHYKHQLSKTDQENEKDQCSDKSETDLTNKSCSENQKHVKSSSDNQEIKDQNVGKQKDIHPETDESKNKTSLELKESANQSNRTNPNAQNQNLHTKQHFCDKSSSNFSTSCTEENNSSVQKSREPLKRVSVGKLCLTLTAKAPPTKTGVQKTVGLQNMGLKDPIESQNSGQNIIARTACCAGGQSSTMPDDGEMAEVSTDVKIQVESDDSHVPDQKGVCDFLPICRSQRMYK
ncbi:uncharacterized protein [Nothobranchius furzeri]|uniref:uncharacterized protein isoform X4 n=1 Tax=Nothobranchius furzeri TaxID=105023 RepID=UPI003904D362